MEKYRSDNVIYAVGHKSYKEIAQLYRQHDIFIHMGDHEGLGLGFYESIVCGTPILTIDTPLNNEIIHEGLNGWLVKCDYLPLNDNKEGIVMPASITVADVKEKMLMIIQNYQRDAMYHSTLIDYMKVYPIDQYCEQLRKILQ